jgi:hypothetical protein
MLASLLLVVTTLAPGQAEGMAQPKGETPTFGVEPIAVGRRAKRREQKAAKRLSPQLLARLKGERDDVVEVKVKGKQPPRVRNDAKRRAAALKRAQDGGLSRVVTSQLDGKGKRVKLVVEVIGPGLEGVVASVEVRPLGADRKDWADKVFAVVGPEIEPPPPPPEPEPPPQPPAPPPEPPAPAPDPAKAAPASPPSAGTMWPILLGSTGVFVGLAGAMAGAGGGFFAYAAWQQSEDLVPLPAGARRTAQEEASVQKAIIADALFVTAGVALLGGVGLWVGALFVE